MRRRKRKEREEPTYIEKWRAKHKLIQFWLKKSEYRDLRKIADTYNMTVQDFLKSIAFGKVLPEFEKLKAEALERAKEEIEQYREELKRQFELEKERWEREQRKAVREEVRKEVLQELLREPRKLFKEALGGKKPSICPYCKRSLEPESELGLGIREITVKSLEKS